LKRGIDLILRFFIVVAPRRKSDHDMNMVASDKNENLTKSGGNPSVMNNY